jgi:hypothetical protein
MRHARSGWDRAQIAPLYSETGRRGIPARFAVGLLILKHIYGLSDEGVCQRWVYGPHDGAALRPCQTVQAPQRRTDGRGSHEQSPARAHKRACLGTALPDLYGPVARNVAKRKGASYADLLEEVSEPNARPGVRGPGRCFTRTAGFPAIKTLEAFDFAFAIGSTQKIPQRLEYRPLEILQIAAARRQALPADSELYAPAVMVLSAVKPLSKRLRLGLRRSRSGMRNEKRDILRLEMEGSFWLRKCCIGAGEVAANA